MLSEADEEEEDDDEDQEQQDEAEEDEDDEEASQVIEVTKLVFERDRLYGAVDLSKLDSDFASGVSWLSAIFTSDGDALTVVSASMRLPSGEIVPLEITRRTEEPAEAAEQAEDEEAKEDEEDEEAAEVKEAEQAEEAEGTEAAEASEASDTETDVEASDEEREEREVAQTMGDDEADAVELPEVEVLYPLGAYGVTAAPETPRLVLFRGATVWTCGPRGIIEGGDVLVEDGKIAAVGKGLSVPEGCEVIDVSGKHLTPGLIDCHSHMATDGGVNESGQGVTCEVRIEDFIDNSDISIYRQLAGGLTTSNILHGSANPIGGQNQVIKLRWGATMDEMKFSGAPKGVKFALGENVKRRSGRYPDTRMGVEQIIYDQLLAAAEYAAAHRRYAEGDRGALPPRVDLQLEALAEVLAGERWIHCHSYRQDEIVALLDVLDQFGVTIGSLQHILEGYKVADRMAEHGATASSFSDWWAYKFEVYDAIPHNGKLMHDQGIVVSFNSDDAELARHLNTEAAKAIKYGGVSPEEALKFVTLNPAIQLRIEDRVGSLEEGKDADVVVWSGPPMSTMTRCEQTWIDGRPYFTLERDRQLQRRDQRLHAYLVQKALGNDGKGSGARRQRISEEQRWHRHDIFCLHHDHEGGHLDQAGDHAAHQHNEEAEQ
jgi:N-acetylglucosamine-6-phosphate deacetylase